MKSLERTGNAARIGAIGPAIIALAFSAALLAACGGTREKPASGLAGSTQAPTALAPQRDASVPVAALTGQVNEPELRKAVERYRLVKHRDASPVDFAGVDLNGDGRSEAIVLFSGKDWCLRTGCSLVVFQEEETGFRPVSHITRVRPPVAIGPENSFGWSDLIVQTGGGAAPVKTVRLGFSGKGYPENALLQPEPVQDTLTRSQQVLPESPAFVAAMNQLSTQSSTE